MAHKKLLNVRYTYLKLFLNVNKLINNRINETFATHKFKKKMPFKKIKYKNYKNFNRIIN